MFEITVMEEIYQVRANPGPLPTHVATPGSRHDGQLPATSSAESVTSSGIVGGNKITNAYWSVSKLTRTFPQDNETSTV